MLYASSVSAQELTISGTVISKVTGDALPGANIVVKGTQLGTTTDVEGKFRLNLVGMSQATLVVSFIGYRTVEIPVTSSTQDLGISLDEDVLKLSGVVVTGVATSVSRRNLANSVATVSASELIARRANAGARVERQIRRREREPKHRRARRRHQRRSARHFDH
jgi:hypothetical protein